MTPPAGQNVGRPEGWQRLSSRSSRLRGNSAPLPPCLALRWRRMRLERDAAPEARHGPPRRTPSPLPIMPHPGRRPGVLTRGAGHSTPSNGSHPGACPSPLPQFRRAPLHFGWPASHTVACQPRPNALPGTVPTVTRRRDQCPLCIGGPLLSPRHSAPLRASKADGDAHLPAVRRALAPCPGLTARSCGRCSALPGGPLPPPLSHGCCLRTLHCTRTVRVLSKAYRPKQASAASHSPGARLLLSSARPPHPQKPAPRKRPCHEPAATAAAPPPRASPPGGGLSFSPCRPPCVEH